MGESGARQIEGEDGEERLKEGMGIIRLCGVMYGRGYPWETALGGLTLSGGGGGGGQTQLESQ